MVMEPTFSNSEFWSQIKNVNNNIVILDYFKAVCRCAGDVIKKQPILKFTPLGYTLDKRQSLAETTAKTLLTLSHY